MTGVRRTTLVHTIFGTITVSSVKTRMEDKTVVILPEMLALIHETESTPVGLYKDHETVVDSIWATMPPVQ